MTERTLTALRNSFDGKVYIIIKGDELQKQFLKDAENEGFHFGTIKPTDHVGVRARMSRSNMDNNLLGLLREGVITLEDLAEFSDELQNQMRLIVERTSMIFDDYE